MKRIALLLLLGFYFVACNNPVDPDPGGDEPGPNTRDIKTLSLRIHVPTNGVSTYANEDASAEENTIDSIFIDLYQGSSTTPIHEGRFGPGSPDYLFQVKDDSTILIGYEVDNITTGTLTARVFANKKEPERISSEIDLPSVNPFYMSGEGSVILVGSAYEGDIRIQRNVAKLRVLITKNDPVIPSDLIIDYENVRIQVYNVPDSTTDFGGPIDGITSINYFAPHLSSPHHNIYYADHINTTLRKITNPLPLPQDGGQIDSLYLYENLRNTYNYNATNHNDLADRTTKVRVTIPTMSLLEGNKSASYTYTLYTNNDTDFKIFRNYIYTLNIIVKGQELDPLISLDVKPWNDVPVSGDIYGTYLTLDQSEIRFDSDGKALINFCTDAQAIYFDFTDFNDNNPTAKFGVGGAIKPIDIDTTRVNFPLAPTGYQSAQILVDKQHCGTFGFELDKTKFPTFPNVTFSGQICMKAGNIVKCLTFPSYITYDAHFIVGEPLFLGEQFTSAVVSSGSSWMEVSPDRLYTTNTGSAYPLGGGTGAAAQLYLHLNENLSSSSRTGTITFKNGNVEKIINITQLPALRVGAFGYNPLSATDDTIYTAQLYTEQLYEFTHTSLFGFTMPAFMPGGGNQALPGNALYNGRMPAILFDDTYYNNESFNYQAAVYAAINYCAYKNRPAIKTPTGALTSSSDIKWYLPSQAQLMAMWITYETYKDSPNSNFYRMDGSTLRPADIFWSSTDNSGYDTQAQYVDFRYGNVGHYERTQPYWARCVRDTVFAPSTSNMVERRDTTGTDWGTLEFPHLQFDFGLPLDPTYMMMDKVDYSHHEGQDWNKSVYMRLRVANSDLNGGALTPWAIDICSSYKEADNFGVWRLPSQRELQAIWVLQHEMKQKCSSFNLLDDYYYWSGTNASTTNGSNAWTVYGSGGSKALLGGSGNTPHQLKATPLKVRCVLQYMGPLPTP